MKQSEMMSIWKRKEIFTVNAKLNFVDDREKKKKIRLEHEA